MTVNDPAHPVAHRRPEWRRRLVVAGALTSLSAGGLLAARAHQSVDYGAAPYAGWTKAQAADKDADVAHHAAFCGTLAANAHNTQPWRFRVEPDRIAVLPEPTNLLGSADPQRHMQMMSLGSAVENICVAARQLGRLPQVRWCADLALDGNGNEPCAEIELGHGGTQGAEPTYAALFERRTNRGPYDMSRAVPDAVLHEIVRSNDFTGVTLSLHRADSAQAREIALYTKYGVRLWLKDDQRHRDGMRWWRADRAELLQRRDGISIHTTDAPFFVKQGMDSLVDHAMWSGDFGKSGEIHSVDKVLDPTPVWGLITARPGDAAAVRAGALLERVYLEATRRGYALHPLNYATELKLLQTYSKRVLPMPQGESPLIVFRLGAPEMQVEPSVRRDFTTTLV